MAQREGADEMSGVRPEMDGSCELDGKCLGVSLLRLSCFFCLFSFPFLFFSFLLYCFSGTIVVKATCYFCSTFHPFFSSSFFL